MNTPLATTSIGRQQLVEPVLADGAVIGFVPVTFETGRAPAISDHHYRKSDRYMYMMVLMSCVACCSSQFMNSRSATVKGEKPVANQ